MESLVLSLIEPWFLPTITTFVLLSMNAVYLIRNKLTKIKSFTENQKKNLKSCITVLLVFVLAAGIISVPILKDMAEQKTNIVVGTVTIGSTMKNYEYLVVETADEKLTIHCPIIDEYNIIEGEEYEVEYFINSKTLKNAELLEDN